MSITAAQSLEGSVNQQSSASGTIFVGNIAGPPGPPGATGATGATGPQGPPGESYILTDDDKQEIAKIVLEESPASVSSWNDLTDKPFGEEAGTEVVLEELTFTSAYADGVYLGAISSVSAEFVAGETYSVIWDGAEHKCEAMDESDLDEGTSMPAGAIIMGNLSAMGMSGNNEPFLIMSLGTDLAIMCVTDTTPTEHTLAIYKDGTVIKTLDPKFLASATSIDLSGFESEGKIVETFADGSVITTVMEFDDNGKPTKISDSNGNVTVLTW